jgi:hypothetical protein
MGYPNCAALGLAWQATAANDRSFLERKVAPTSFYEEMRNK